MSTGISGYGTPLGCHDDVKVIFCGRALKEENHNIGLPPQLESVRVRHDIFSQSVSQSRNSEEAVERNLELLEEGRGT